MEVNIQTDKDILSGNMSDDYSLLGSADSTAMKNIACNKPKHPCDPEPKCPTTPCDPSNVRLQCSSKGVYFKLTCSKLPPDCNHPEARYDCELIDEGQNIDIEILSSCDLKCDRIPIDVNSDHTIVIEDNSEIAQIQELTTMIGSKDGVNCSMKCTMRTPDFNQPDDVRFLCEIGEKGSEHKVSPDELQDIPFKCTDEMDDSVLEDSVAKDNSMIENLSNPLLTDICKEQEDNLETLIDSDDNDERPLNQCIEDDKNPEYVDCGYVKSELPLNPYDEYEEHSRNNIKLICVSPPEPPSSSNLAAPICQEISDLLENNKIIYACRSKSKMDKVENKCTTNSSESENLDCIEKDENKYCEEQPVIDSLEKIEIYKCTKSHHSPEQEHHKSCTDEEESVVTQLTTSFIEHHNKTVKIIKVAATDLLSLITDASKGSCKKNTSDEFKCINIKINTVMEFTKDTINAVTAHASKFIGSDEECEDELNTEKDVPKLSEPKTCPKPRQILGRTSPNEFIEPPEDIDNKENKDECEVHEQLHNDNQQAHDDITVKTAILINETQDIYGKVHETTKHIIDETPQVLSDVLTSLTDDVKNKVPNNGSEENSPFKPSPPQEINYNFDSDEYSYESDDSIPKTNIFTTLKNKIRAMFCEHSNTDSSTTPSSSLSNFTDDSDGDNMPARVN